MAIPVITSLNPLEENITFQKTPVSDKFYSSKLLNYVESIDIAGFLKTVFYTELNTNFNVGDRVFILNGNYDSDEFIGKDKYAKYTDGYRVLGCDGCRVILDLDYTDTLPYSEAAFNKAIKVYHVRNQREFDYINSIKVGSTGISFLDQGTTYTPFPNNFRVSKFGGKKYNLGSNPVSTLVLFADSIVYLSDTFVGSNSVLNSNSGSTFGTGFFVRDDTSSTPQWIDVTQEVLSNQIRIVNPNYSDIENLLYIYGENFSIINNDFIQRNVYAFDGTNWNLSSKYKVPYISRLNFRYGNFRGTHKDGIFGTSLKKNNWNGARWTSGCFINSVWNNGVMNSKSTSGEKSFYSTYNSDNLRPVQTIDFSNNKGFGYNLLEDSTFVTGDIKNGNFENCNLGYGNTFSALDIYFGLTYSFEMSLSGFYRRCDIQSVSSDKAKFINSNITNSNLNNTELVNSQVYSSSANQSTFTDEEGIVIESADLWAYTTSNLQSSIRGILKLYISESDYSKVSIGDSFYLSRVNKELFLNSFSNDEKIKIPLETKYLFDIYNDFELSSSKITVTLRSKDDNKVKTTVEKNGNNFNTVYTNISLVYASIDIESDSFGWYRALRSGGLLQTSGTITTPSQAQLAVFYVSSYNLYPVRLQNVNEFFSGTYLSNSDFKTGIFNSSIWKSGANINYNHHIIPFNGSNLNMSYATNDTLFLGLLTNQLNPNINIPGEDLVVGDTVWLDSIDHIVGTNVKSVSGRYRVSAVNTLFYKELYLRSLDGLTFSTTATFRINSAEDANYISVNKFRIQNSTINAGLLCRTSLKSNTIYNSDFNNTDKLLDMSNIQRLRLINILFKNSNNTVKSGYIHKSHFINDIWTSGIIYNSIWNGGTFGDGIFNNGYWKTGTFNNGSFINSKDTVSSIQSYDNNPVLYRTWLNGTFNLGEFFNSTWMNGVFNNGRLYNSEWYAGTWNNGILGSLNFRSSDTKFGWSSPLLQSSTFSVWNDGIAENAIVGGSGSVYWYGGKFNNGEFTSFDKITSNESIWYNGDFNNGRFSGLARWKNGKFHKGKFHSFFGLTASSPTNPSTYSTSYSWENGKFMGGEFGDGSTSSNSVWYSGEFSGGVFQGKFWYDGLFTNGEFKGSGSSSLIYSSKDSPIGEYTFADSYRTDYYGLWYDGIVSDNPKIVKTDERVMTEISRKQDEQTILNSVLFTNMLWKNGTFSHKGGTIQSSLWLSGNFDEGVFDSSIFNPYIDRTFTSGLTSSFATTFSCIWTGGRFESTVGTGSFYISDWKNGTFHNGYMAGSTWKNGVWNYGFADNILWLDGLWRNGNWNGAPYGFNVLERDSLTFSFLNGREKDIVINVGNNLGNVNIIYLNNVFSASTSIQILTDPTITTLIFATRSVDSNISEQYNYYERQTSTSVSSLGYSNQEDDVSPPTILDCSIWSYGTTFSTSSTSVISNTHVFTTGGDFIPNTRIEPESNKLYAYKDGYGREIFYESKKSYIIDLEMTVEGYPQVDVFIKVGNKPEVKISLLTNQQPLGRGFVYYPKQYNLTFIYTTPEAGLLYTSESKQFYLRKGRGGKLRVLKLNIVQREYEYHPVYNNRLFGGAINFSTKKITLPPKSQIVEVLAVSSDANLVSINIGNGLFRSGVWENGIWNNGFRSNSFTNEETTDYYKFSNIVGLNGVFPYSGKGTYQISSTTWLVTLQALESLIGLNVGNKVSIGNLVAIDINESRKLIKDYFTITQIDLVNNTIVVELISNFPIIRVEKDSSNHLIYVSKNVWLTGAFLNGIFRGIWNNGLFKSYPRIGVVANTHWIDGKLDGGRFISKKIDDLGFTYSTSVIQNITFMDNNAVDPLIGSPKYNTWLDLNYDTQRYTTINTDSSLATLEGYPNTNPSLITFTYSTLTEQLAETSRYPDINGITQSTKLQGGITEDVLESFANFKLSNNSNYTYKLGTKFNVYQNSIPNDGNFINPFSNNLGFGIDMTNFDDDGWDYKDYSLPFFSSSNSTKFVLTGSQLNIDSNVSAPGLNLEGKFRLKSGTLVSSSIIQIWSVGNFTLDFRFIRFILNNDNIQTEKNRYYITSVGIDKLVIATASFSGPGTRQATAKFNLAPNINDYSLYTGTRPITKTQYFYNKKKLDLNIEVYSQYQITNANTNVTLPLTNLPSLDNNVDIVFNNISFLEVDMIPFFNYFGNIDLIDNRIKTPWFAVAPFIDYSNSNFDFLGNVNLTIDSELINNQASFTLISVGGISGTIVNTSTEYVSFSTSE